jgi:hypothetical protein
MGAVFFFCDSQNICRDARKLRYLRSPPLINAKQSRDCMQRTRAIPGAGVTPAEGSVKPTAGFTSNEVIYPSQKQFDRAVGLGL